MNSPSAVSITAIPAANRIGRVSNAYQGSPAAAPVPASASRAGDFGGGVESKPEQQSDTEHVDGSSDAAHNRPKDSRGIRGCPGVPSTRLR